jgi:hypothetical protein
VVAAIFFWFNPVGWAAAGAVVAGVAVGGAAGGAAGVEVHSRLDTERVEAFDKERNVRERKFLLLYFPVTANTSPR